MEIVIHGTELLAVQAHPVAVPTWNERKADAEVRDTDVVDRTTAQVGAAWVTEKTRPPTLSVPVLAPFVVLAAIE